MMANSRKGRLYMRKKLRRIKPWECEVCHAKKELTVHHKNGVTDNYSLENLMVLCRSCHDTMHGNENLNEKWALHNEISRLSSVWHLKQGYQEKRTEVKKCRICGRKGHNPWVHISDQWSEKEHEEMAKYSLERLLEKIKNV